MKNRFFLFSLFGIFSFCVFNFAKISHSFSHDTSSFPPRTSEPMAQRASHLLRHDGCFQRGSSLRLDGDRRARRFAGRFPHHSFVRAFLRLFNFSDILLSSHEAGAHFLLHVAGFSSRQVWSAHFVAHAGRWTRHPVLLWQSVFLFFCSPSLTLRW